MGWVFILSGLLVIGLTVPQVIKQRSEKDDMIFELEQRLKVVNDDRKRLQHSLNKRPENGNNYQLQQQIKLMSDNITRLVEQMRNGGQENNASGDNSFATVLHQVSNQAPDPLSNQLSMFNEIYKDYDGGKNVTQIARKHNRGKGEIELILSLRKQSVG